MFQLRVSLVKDTKKQEEMWERQHEQAADKIYFMCSDLGGFFLKVLKNVVKCLDLLHFIVCCCVLFICNVDFFFLLK